MYIEEINCICGDKAKKKEFFDIYYCEGCKSEYQPRFDNTGFYIKCKWGKHHLSISNNLKASLSILKE